MRIILQKTSLPRENAPKIELCRREEEKEDESETFNKEITLEDKNTFTFLSAYDQLKDVKTSNLRPKKPTGTTPHIAFEINLVGEQVQGLAGPYRAFFEDISSEL